VGRRRELDSVGVDGRAFERKVKPVGAGANPLAAGRSPVVAPMVGDGMAGSPPAIIRETRQISGLTSRRLQRLLPRSTRSQIGRLLRRLRLHGLIKKVGQTYKYYATSFGQRLLLAGLKLKEHLLLPTLSAA